MSANNLRDEPQAETLPFEELRSLVESEFQVEESFIEYGRPTFHIRRGASSKQAFLRLVERLDSHELVPVLREKEDRTVLRILGKPDSKPSRRKINIVLLFATLGTVLLAGYLQSPNVIDAALFTGAILAILGSHEMGHKLAADKHQVEATYPYFIPGPPPIGTFGAVIRQKSLPPNRDALFDIGSTGPITGFLVATAITILGFPLSSYTWIPSDAPTLPASLLFKWIADFFPVPGTIPPQTDPNTILAITLHPVAFAGWVGMIVTTLNLIPVGMFDGGHIAHVFLGNRTRKILSYATIGIFLALGLLIWNAFLMWAILAIFFSSMRHPGPLDDTSKVTTTRKLVTIGIVAIFILSFPILA